MHTSKALHGADTEIIILRRTTYLKIGELDKEELLNSQRGTI